MDTDIVVRVAVAVIVLVLGLALLVYNVQRKWRRMKSELKRADVRRRALLAAERS